MKILHLEIWVMARKTLETTGLALDKNLASVVAQTEQWPTSRLLKSWDLGVWLTVLPRRFTETLHFHLSLLSLLCYSQGSFLPSAPYFEEPMFHSRDPKLLLMASSRHMCIHVYVTHKVLDGAAFNDFQLQCLGKKCFLGVVKRLPGVRSLTPVLRKALVSIVLQSVGHKVCLSVSCQHN